MSIDELVYPRVLVLAQNRIQPYTGGGVVLANLFGGFPTNRVMFLHRDQEYGFDSGFEEYRLLGRWLRPRWQTLCVHLGRWLVRLFKGEGRRGDLSKLLAQSSYFRLPREMDLRVREFRPQILYVWVSDLLWVETVRSTARRYSIPYVIHFMDNHLGLAPEGGLEAVLYPSFRVALDSVARSAEALLTISDSMGCAYEALWGRPYEVYHGVIEPLEWSWPNPMVNRDSDDYLLAFTGSVEAGQMRGLIDVAHALDGLEVKGRRARLVLYLTETYAARVRLKLADFKLIEIRPHPDFRSLRSELASVDALLLAYGFDQRTVCYYQYSFATKIVPYMLSGRPILAYGPKGIEPVNYAIKGGWALVVDESQPSLRLQRLREAVGELMDDPDAGYKKAYAAWRAGCHEHDLKDNAARFIRSLAAKARTDN